MTYYQWYPTKCVYTNPSLYQGSLSGGGGLPAGVTALMTAAKNCNKEVVDMLLDKGADVDKAATDDGTALSDALQGGDQEIIAMVASRTRTVVGLERIYDMIARKKVEMSEPLEQFIRRTIGRTWLGDRGGIIFLG